MFPIKQKCPTTQRSLCISWYGWHLRKEAPNFFLRELPGPWHLVKPKLVYISFKEIASPFYICAAGSVLNRKWRKAQFFHTTFRRAMSYPSQNGVQYPTLPWETINLLKSGKRGRVIMLCFQEGNYFNSSTLWLFVSRFSGMIGIRVYRIRING